MSTYNKAYTLNPALLSCLHSHADELRAKYSKLLTFRMDFFYMKGTPLYDQRVNDWSCRDIYMLVERLIDTANIVGYSWVMERTEQHGIHYHVMFYLNGNLHKKYYPAAQEALHRWSCITHRQGGVHICDPAKNNYPVNGQGMFKHHHDQRFNELYYALSYLAKEEQKDGLYCYGLSYVPKPDGRGRPRTSI
ncbi:YagK/YfjJ domain-containing protein [Yersinia intermedia]|uniref:YagK/YfjJ domain-containing protein n=1 Tax=Yersinia intermedia TaxID=631 RepID=UPI0011A31D33|nr:inovirus-type Gp2 protein [Yersinia intermedia]